ncbi:Xaa-Pro peptidase family protein [Natronococcus sp. A-GB1]|uniref:M24 family metallopeptidase n=1 Tax=Natronococcus sp. A-GB1 TaxID=3037648 RepID=UPI0024201DFD|nr:Xaa-Pro peptidase family protein [Natronococcus sp. A-GB1]MDG5760014.1 Xaa-Pro peptidase family protein [Natronococcus sp. A-GB1]
MTGLTIPETTHRDRKRELLDRADADGYDGVVLFGSLNIHYVSGMYHLATERPVALGVTDERVEAVVPRLEQEHASRDDFLIDDVTTYFEYPQSDPMGRVAEMCDRLEIADGAIAVDLDGSPARNGYTGPSLSELVAADVSVEEYVTEMRETKSDHEIELIREASVWANLGHQLLQDRIEVGRRPIEVRAEVEAEAVKPMLDALGDRYEMRSWANPMQCLFTTGEVTALPHSMNQTNRIERGDNVVTIVKPTVGGYTTELERTMFVDEASDAQRTYFEIMKESQEIAIDAIGPGVEYAAVEEAVVDYYEEQGVAEYAQHHVGHNIGMEGHERPFLDVGQAGEIQPGELFTVEPGFYLPDLGGFRHSDTVLVTDNGTETLTYYPRDLGRLIV